LCSNKSKTTDTLDCLHQGHEEGLLRILGKKRLSRFITVKGVLKTNCQQQSLDKLNPLIKDKLIIAQCPVHHSIPQAELLKKEATFKLYSSYVPALWVLASL
jgi:hypothetical protein